MGLKYQMPIWYWYFLGIPNCWFPIDITITDCSGFIWPLWTALMRVLPTIYFLRKIIPRLSNPVQLMSILHYFKMKKNAPCFQIRAGDWFMTWHDTGFVTENPRRATGVEPVIPGVQILGVSSSRHRGLAGGRQVNNSTSIALIFFVG